MNGKPCRSAPASILVICPWQWVMPGEAVPPRLFGSLDQRRLGISVSVSPDQDWFSCPHPPSDPGRIRALQIFFVPEAFPPTRTL